MEEEEEEKLHFDFKTSSKKRVSSTTSTITNKKQKPNEPAQDKVVIDLVDSSDEEPQQTEEGNFSEDLLSNLSGQDVPNENTLSSEDAFDTNESPSMDSPQMIESPSVESSLPSSPQTETKEEDTIAKPKGYFSLFDRLRKTSMESKMKSKRSSTPVDSSKSEITIDSDSDQEFHSPHKRFILPSAMTPVGDPLVLSENPRVEVPGSINVHLREYQRDGVKFLFKLFQEDKGGILADDMGLGKTLQTISFIAAILGTGGKETQGSDWFFEKNLPKAPKPDPVIVVMPASVLSQWQREFSKWTRIRTDIYHGKNRGNVLANCRTGRCQVMLTSYETFRLNMDDINGMKWSCMIFDEVHKIKNKASKITKSVKEVPTNRRYGLTGTVMQNSFDELWTLLDFINPNSLGTLQQFRAHYVNPIKTGQRKDASYGQIAKSRLCSKRLSERIRQLVLRREKSLIADSLPRKEDHVVLCRMTPLQKAMYQRVLSTPELKLLRQLGQKCDCGSKKSRGECCYANQVVDGVPVKDVKKLLLPSISRLMKIANHPGLLQPADGKDLEKKEREKLFESVAYGSDEEVIREALSKGDFEDLCGKLNVLKSLLPVWKEEGSKVLLFSNSTRNLDFLEQFLRREKHSFCRLDGSTPASQRQRIVDHFNATPNKFIFLISTKAGGLGLNLVSANTVVVFDPNWNVTHDLQAQDRAYRIGQTRNTSVYRLISAGSIEELIYNRQVYKQQMASVGVAAKSERRYFRGVQGLKGQEGELFGAANLFTLMGEAGMTEEILRQSKEEEKLYHIEHVKDEKKERNGEEGSDMNLMFTESYKDLEGLPNTSEEKDESNILQLMKAAGVLSSHLNSDVVGESAYEKLLGMKASQDMEEQIQRENQLRAQHEWMESFQRAQALRDSMNSSQRSSQGFSQRPPLGIPHRSSQSFTRSPLGVTMPVVSGPTRMPLTFTSPSQGFGRPVMGMSQGFSRGLSQGFSQIPMGIPGGYSFKGLSAAHSAAVAARAAQDQGLINCSLLADTLNQQQPKK